MTRGTSTTGWHIRTLATVTALISFVSVALGVAAPAQAETWVNVTTYPVTFANGIAVTSDGVTAVVGSGTQTTLSVITIATGAKQTVEVGTVTGSIVIDASNTYAYVVSLDTSKVIRLNLSDLTFSSVSVSFHPRYLLFDNSGDYLYVQGESGADRITLSTFTAETGYFSGAVVGPIAQTDSGAIYIDGNNTVQRFDQAGLLVDSYSRANHVVYAAAVSADNNYLIGVDDNGKAYRTDLTTKVTEFWGQGLGYGAGYGDMLVRGDFAYITGVLGQTVTKFSLSDIGNRTELLNLGGGYPKALAAPADGSFFLLTVPGRDEVVKYSIPTAPTTPNAPTAVAGDGQATVSASAASAGSPATSLKVTANPGGAYCEINSTSGDCTITGLENGTAYTFTVVATNDVGDSDPSDPSAPVTPEPAGTAPSAGVVKITGSAVVGGTLSASITNVAGSGSVARGWAWQRKKGASGWVDIASANAPTYTLKATDLGYILRARVVLSNELGDATYSSAASAVVLNKPAKPDEPTSVKASFTAKKAKAWTITVTWAKVKSPKDDAITKYNVVCRAGKIKLMATTTGAKTSASVSATKATTYSCVVTATRERGGTSPASDAAKVVVK